MPKEVKTLKPKHTHSLWLDPEGDVWFWDAELEEWNVLAPEMGGGYVPMKFPHYGPFRKLHTSYLKGL